MGTMESIGLDLLSITEENFSEVQQIYALGIASGHATFETTVPGWNTWHAAHLEHSRITVYRDGRMLGWGALSPVSERCVYQGVAEVSVYVHPDAQGQGIGSVILENLIRSSEANGIWSLMSGIFPENKASLQLHRKHGFRIVGVREKIGRMNGTWRDTVLLQRRSTVVGID